MLIKLFLELVRAIYIRIHCPPGGSTFTIDIRDNEARPLAENPSLKFVPGHGGEYLDDLDRAQPDVVVTTGDDKREGPSLIGTWGHVESTWEIRYHEYCDMCSHGQYEHGVVIVPRMLRHQASESPSCQLSGSYLTVSSLAILSRKL